jgi:hypothetical protein
MKPVWIKYYGVIPMTKWGYLVALGVAAFVAVVFLIVVGAAGYLPPISTIWQSDPKVKGPGLGPWLYNHLYHITLFCILAQGIDTYMVLRRFAQKEAEQRAHLSAPPPKEEELPYD